MLLNKIVKISSIILRIRTWGLCLKNNSQSESNQPYVITPVGFYLQGRVRIVDDTFRNRWSLNQTTTIKKKTDTEWDMRYSFASTQNSIFTRLKLA